MAGGLRNPHIAERLFITNATVKSHVNRIFSKLGVTTRVEAILKYQEASSSAHGEAVKLNPVPSTNTARV